MARVIQGTWEEILLHSEQLRGRQGLVLTVPSKNEADHTGDIPSYLSETLAALLEEGKHIRPETPSPLTDPHEQAFGEIMAEKYRKMGFKL